MKVLLSAYACQPHYGSEAGRGWNLAFYLAQMNHSIWVLTLDDNKSAIQQQLALLPM